MLGKAGRSETFPGLNKMSTPYPCPPSPQASAYLKQNKYQQAEELYKEILSQEALPAPLGEPTPAPSCTPSCMVAFLTPASMSLLSHRSPPGRHSRRYTAAGPAQEQFLL